MAEMAVVTMTAYYVVDHTEANIMIGIDPLINHLKHISAIIDHLPILTEPIQIKALLYITGNISLEDIDFSYNDEETVLSWLDKETSTARKGFLEGGRMGEDMSVVRECCRYRSYLPYI